MFLAGCSHSNAQLQNSVPNSPYFAEQLTFVGNNENPTLSPDGKKLLFQSRERAQHKAWQIYEYDLSSRKERRVTFSDGEAFDPRFLSPTEIVYASTTDEIKEDPFGPRSLLKRPSSDLYHSDLYGTSIERLTKQPGYDAQPFFREKPVSSILFASSRGEILGLYQLNLKTLVVSLISAEKGKEKNFPSISPDQQVLAWVENEPESKKQDLMVMAAKTKVSRLVKTEEGQIQGAHFVSAKPNRLIYSLTKKGRSTIELYDIDKNCTQTLYTENAILTSPHLLLETPARLIFGKKIKAQSQLYIKTLADDLGPCKELAAVDKINQ